MIALGLANLWRMKLRSGLTLLGVVIGIGALTSMISFGTGIQKNITDAFRKNDLFTSIYVTSRNIDIEGMTRGDFSGMLERQKSTPPPLNDSTLMLIRSIKEVQMTYPILSIRAKLKMLGRINEVSVTGLPFDMHEFPPFNKITYGRFFENDSSAVVLLNWNSLRKMNILVDDPEKPIKLTGADRQKGMILISPDSLIGKPIYLVTAMVDIPSLWLGTFGHPGSRQFLPLKEITTPFIIGGIIRMDSPFEAKNLHGDIWIPFKTALKIPSLALNNLMDMLDGHHHPGDYGTVYVRVRNPAGLEPVLKKLKDMKFNVVALADQLSEIKNNFLILDGVLAAIGTVALIIAGLGITNTMVMSILERTREIGIMKAIGGSESQVRMIFITEAGVIGFLGSIFGLLLGWLVAHIANRIANSYILPTGESPVNFFYFPAWLILGAIAFSIILSQLAGLYPASRAAKIDPVMALRHD